MNSIEELRREVGEVTLEIVRLLAKRIEIVKKIGEEKERLGLRTDAPETENKLLRIAIEEANKLGIDEEIVTRILSIVFLSSKKIQSTKRRKSIAYEFRKNLVENKKIIRLDVGEPYFKPPRAVIEEVGNATRKGFIRYSSAAGLPKLREAIATHLNEKYNLDLKADNVIVTSGGRLALYLSLASSLRQGDNVIMFEPMWDAYREISEFLYINPIVIETKLENLWEPNLSEVESYMANAAIINYPNNPTGKILDEPLLDKLVELFKKKRMLIISDEVYSDYIFNKKFKSILSYDCDSIVIGSFSKTFSMTGFRIGFAVSSKERIEKMTKIQQTLLTNVPEFIQFAAIKALESYPETIKKNLARIRIGLEETEKFLKEIPVSYYRPDGGFYFFLRVNLKNFDSENFSYNLLKKHNVAIAPGTIYGNFKDYIRISFCQSIKKLRVGLKKLKVMIDESRNSWSW